MMNHRAVQAIADKIYGATLILFDERIEENNYKNQLLRQLDDYYKFQHKDETYLRNLQFMYDHWQKTLPQKETPPIKKVIKFFNPIT